MELSYTPQENAFRREVQDWLAANLPAAISDKVRQGQRLKKQDIETWHALLNNQGWLAQGWPKVHGGAEWSPVQRHIFEEEATQAHAPRVLPFGLLMIGPVLMQFGTSEQKEYYLPRILNGEHWWCQGYSEPGAGSDLAALRTQAVLDGDHYIVNGQKTWTTLGQHADWMFCLVRTDPDAKKQSGISFLLIDMNSPGVSVRPIALIDGGAEVNEVFFDNVRVPVGNLVGQENRGWDCAKFLLTHERTTLADVGHSTAALATLKRLAAEIMQDGKPLAENPLFAARIARVEIDLMALSTTNLRVLSADASGQPPGPESSMLKLKGAVIRQEWSSLIRRAIGPAALPSQNDFLNCLAEPIGPDHAAAALPTYLNMRKLSIFGGSNEIQRNILARTILGM